MVHLIPYFNSHSIIAWSSYNIMALNVLDKPGHRWLYRVIEFRLKSMVKLYAGTQSYCQHHEQVIYLPDYFFRKPLKISSENSTATGQWKMKLNQPTSSKMRRRKAANNISGHGWEVKALPGPGLNKIYMCTLSHKLYHTEGTSIEPLCTCISICNNLIPYGTPLVN
jgi:hypothetical protein